MPSLPKGCAFLGLGPICTGCSRGDLGQNGGKPGGREARRRETRRHAGPVRLRARHPLLGRGIISPALSSHPRTTWHYVAQHLLPSRRSSSVPVPLRRTGSSGECTSSDLLGPLGRFSRESSRSHLRNGFVQPLVVVVLDEASEGLHPRSPFAVHPVGTVPPLKRERRCGRLEPSWLPPCTWACDCLGRFSSPVTSSTLRCVGFAPPGERLAQTLPVDHRDRQPGSCRSLAGSCSYSRIADLRVLSRF